MLILSISSFFSSFLNVLIAISALMIMVMFHEMGHYIAGKTLGFKINEFSIGFGKAIYSRKAKSGEKFSIRMIPLGGFCAFEGEDEDNVSDMAFNNQKPWKRVIVLVSGVIFNVITAVIVFAILFMSIGYAVPKVYITRR